ncbi:MAG: hypothetical protein ACOYOV_14895 [Bacteroidales bacterium]
MTNLLSFLENAILTDIYDNIIDKDSIKINKHFLKEIYTIEFNHLYNNQNEFDTGLGDFFYRIKSYGCKFQINYTDDKAIVTISMKD